MQRGSAGSSAPMSLIRGGISGSEPRPARGLHRCSAVDHDSSDCGWPDLRLLDGEARKSSLRGVRFRQRQRHTNQRQSIAIVQALPVLTTCPRMGSTSSRACAACHSSQCKQAGVADPENPPFAVVTCTSSPGPFEALPRQSRCPYLPISIRQSDLPEWPSLAATPRLRPSAEQPSCCSRQHRCQRRQPLEGSRSPLPF
jgi:hypothetical protein